MSLLDVTLKNKRRRVTRTGKRIIRHRDYEHENNSKYVESQRERENQ